MTEQPTTAAGRALLEWVTFVEKVDDPAGNTIYDEIRRNFLPAIEAEARQQDDSALRACGCTCCSGYIVPETWRCSGNCGCVAYPLQERDPALAALPPSTSARKHDEECGSPDAPEPGCPCGCHFDPDVYGKERDYAPPSAPPAQSGGLNVLWLAMAIDQHALYMAAEPIHDGGTCTTDCAGDITARYVQEQDR